MRYPTRLSLAIIFILLCNCDIVGQNQSQSSFLTPSDTLNKKRFNLALTGASVTYTAFSIGLYNTWYKQYPQSKFHFFDDWGEWNNMDKAGHLYTAYFQGVLCYKGAKWTGLNDRDAILTGAICGSLFQSTIELMDGFSEQWGFSVGDFVANTAGISAFVLQQKYWNEQRINFKVSSYPKSYSTAPLFAQNNEAQTNLKERAIELYGSNYAESFLKDYNAQIVWASFNLDSFMPNNKSVPKWLNIAIGYGSENMFGGFTNSWESDNNQYLLDEIIYPRHREYYLGLDIDFTRIKVKNKLLKTVLSILNIFKLPLPAVEYNSLGKFDFHFFAK